MAEVDLAVANDHELDIKSTMMYRHDDYQEASRRLGVKFGIVDLSLAPTPAIGDCVAEILDYFITLVLISTACSPFTGYLL